MIEISTNLNDARLQGVVNFLSVGTVNAYADIYPAPRPAFGEVPAVPRLTRIPLADPVGTIPGNGTLAITQTEEALVLIGGIAVWARICNGDDVIGWDCDVSDMAGSGEIKLQSTTLYAGGTTRILSGTIG